ncbi:MAG: hypothetical protein JWR09_3773 [Mucilaginibacter sp.]|nr:hypothetical protein [Mucilaginibacter sp.]
MRKVTFITTGQPTTNPRLVKEVEALIQEGYDVKVICCFYQSWAQKFDGKLKAKYPGIFIYCGGNPASNKISYLKTRVRQKMATRLFRLIKIFGIPENAIGRAHHEMLVRAKRIKSDLYIAHNLGALPAAVLAAKYHHAKVGYDAEDIHSGQHSSQSQEYAINKYAEEKYFPGTNYFTAAGSAIAHYYKTLYPYLNPVVVDNVFKKNHAISIRPHINPLKLFWFSQTIGESRGLEDVITALSGFKPGEIELHLLGNLPDGQFKDQLLKLNDNASMKIIIHAPITPDDIPVFASAFDVGLALEPGFNINNERALSNKLFTYLSAGLAIIATDTIAQKDFMTNYSGIGQLYPRADIDFLRKILGTYLRDRKLVETTRITSLSLANDKLNWEVERIKFLNVVESALS